MSYYDMIFNYFQSNFFPLKKFSFIIEGSSQLSAQLRFDWRTIKLSNFFHLNCLDIYLTFVLLWCVCVCMGVSNKPGVCVSSHWWADRQWSPSAISAEWRHTHGHWASQTAKQCCCGVCLIGNSIITPWTRPSQHLHFSLFLFRVIIFFSVHISTRIFFI